MNFPIQNYQPFSPMAQVPTQAADIYTKLLHALAMPEIMKTEQKTAEQNLLQKQLMNRFYPQLTEAEIGNKQANIPNTQAQTEEIKQRTKLMPIGSFVSLQNAATAQANAARQSQTKNAAWSLVRMVNAKSPADKNVWMAENGAAYNWATNQLLEQAMKAQGGPINNVPNYLTPEIFKKFGLDIPIEENNQSNPTQQLGRPQGNLKIENLNPSQQQELVKALSMYPPNDEEQINANGPTQAPQNDKAEIRGIDSETGKPLMTIGHPEYSKNWSPNQRMQWANMETANQKATGPQLQNRKQAAIALANVMYQPKIQEAFVKLSDPKYLGMLGRTELELKQRFNPKDVAEYLSIRDRLPTLLSGSLKGLEGLPTSTPGMEASSKFFDIARNKKSWVRDPQAALIDVLSAYGLADAETRAIIQSAQPQYRTYDLPESPPSIIQSALDNYQGRDKRSKDLMQQSGLSKNNNSEFETKIENGKVMVKAPNGKWYSEEQL